MDVGMVDEDVEEAVIAEVEVAAIAEAEVAAVVEKEESPERVIGAAPGELTFFLSCARN